MKSKRNEKSQHVWETRRGLAFLRFKFHGNELVEKNTGDINKCQTTKGWTHTPRNMSFFFFLSEDTG